MIPCQWLTVPVSEIVSIALSAEEDLENLTNTTPLGAIRSVLQYSRSGNCDMDVWICWGSAVLGTTINRRERGGVLSRSGVVS